MTISFHDPKEHMPLSSGSSLKMGSVIIQSLIKDLKNNLKDVDELFERINTMKEIMKEAMIEIANFNFNGNIPPEVLKTINDEDDTIGLKILFNKLVDKKS